MRLPEPLIRGRLIERYKRFLADVELTDGRKVTAHCPNSGSMLGLLKPGSEVLLSKNANRRRKLPFTWELMQVDNTWVCVNTLTPNRVVHEALLSGTIPELKDPPANFGTCGRIGIDPNHDYHQVRKEASWGSDCRFDFWLANGSRECYLEVKNVTLAEHGVALFPDARTDRGVKHLRRLIQVAATGRRAVMLFVVNRSDCNAFRPAESIDPVYAETLRRARNAGVEVVVYRTRIEPPVISLEVPLPFKL